MSIAAGATAVERLRAACTTHLHVRIAEHLARPGHWTLK